MDLHPAPGLNVAVSPPVTNAGDCSEEFPLLPLSEIMRLRRDFDWSRQTKVAERNVDGTPTLYYAWIYIRNATESTALRKLYIHTLNRPLFMEELEPYRGRCGTFVNPGDGEGTFVPAVLPGATYNKLIEALTAADLSGDRTIFDVVRLREPPAAARNPNGSIRLDVLGKSGFGYLNYEKRIRDVDEIQLDSAPNVTKLIIDATVWVSDAVRTISREVQQVVAAIAAAFVGRVGITLEVHAINPDPAFTTAANPNPVMVHAWGTWAKARHELGALGMEVTILQQIPGVPLPALSTGKTDRAGKVFIDAVRDARPWENGLCLRHQTSAARVTDLFLASATCDFRAFGVTPNIPDTGNDFQLRDFSKSQALHLHTNMTRLTGLYQADDVWLWSNDVVKYKPRRARILTGYWAENLSKWFGTGGQSTPCLGYTGITPDLLSLAEGSTGILTAIGYGLGTPLATIASSVFLSALTSADIIMPANGSSTLARDRTVMSHEYGHYLFCSLLNEYSPIENNPVEYLAYEALGSGGKDRSNSVMYTNEAMADFIDGQVTGGANYAWTGLLGDRSFYSGGVGSLCADPARLPPKSSEGQCFDYNLSGTANGPDDNRSIGRVITLLHDAFDGHHDRFGVTPSDGDVWQGPPPLSVSPNAFAVTDESYERVAMDGRSLKLFAEYLADGMGPLWTGPGIKDATVYGALNATMADNGYNWCERCRVFALHSPLVSTQVHDGTLTPGNLFDACGNDALIRNAVGANPMSDFRFDWETCAPCPATSTWSNGQCIPCPNRVVDNECIVCPSDIVLQGAELMSDNYATTFSVPGDKCPDTFIVQVNNPSASIHDTQTGFTFEVGPRVVTDADCRQNFTMFAERSNGSELSLDATFSAMGRSNCGTGTIGCTCFDTPEVSYNAGNINGAAFVRVGTPANAKNRLSIILDGPDEGGPH